MVENQKDEENYIAEDILVIEVNEGIFINTDSYEWCSILHSFIENPSENGFVIKPITEQQWKNITIKYREPLKFFGNRKLAWWKLGF